MREEVCDGISYHHGFARTCSLYESIQVGEELLLRFQFSSRGKPSETGFHFTDKE